MVQFLLTAALGRNRVRNAVVAGAIVLALIPASAAGRSKPKSQGPAMVPQLELEGGRKLLYERAFSSELEVKTKRGFWNRVLDIVAGEPDFHTLQGPYGVVSDSKGRIIVTDPAAGGIHIFDFVQQKYKFISRKKGKGRPGQAAMRRGRCRGQYLRDGFGVGQDLRFRCQRKIPARDRQPAGRGRLL